ncbi:MAG: hypothetical protein U0930_10720 [Pirellulales bacterium]
MIQHFSGSQSRLFRRRRLSLSALLISASICIFFGLKWWSSIDDNYAGRLPLNEREILAIHIKPMRMLESPYLWTTCFDYAVPQHISPLQLVSVGVESLTVRAALRSTLETVDTLDPIKWSAIAKLDQPTGLEDLLARWRTAKIVPGLQYREVLHTEDALTFAQIPAGTVLTPVVRSGILTFEDGNGNRLERGLNVGKVDTYYQFVEGGSENCAVFEFSDITKSVMSDGDLRLRLMCSVLNVVSDSGPLSLSVRVRNASTDLISNPIKFEVRPLQVCHISIPEVVQAVVENEPRSFSLSDDFVVEGKLEILLSSEKPGAYIGFGPSSVQTETLGDEFLTVLGSTVYVAETVDSLRQIIAEDNRTQSQPPLTLYDLHLSANLDTEEKKSTARQLLKIGGYRDLKPEYWQAIDTIHICGSFLPSMELKAQIGTSGPSSKRIQTTLAMFITNWWSDRRQDAIASVGGAELIANLLVGVFDGTPIIFPSHQRIKEKERGELLDRFVGTAENAPRIKFKSNTITVDYAQPKFQFKDSQQQSDFLANFHVAIAFDRFNFHRHELGAFIIERSLKYMPDEPMLRLRIAHQLGFNASIDFCELASYQWIRRGLIDLLEGIETDRLASADNYWSAARLVTSKLASDRMTPFFIKDEELQSRLRKATGFDDNSAKWNPIAWFVARQLLQTAISIYERSEAKETVTPSLFYSDYARTFAANAKALAVLGNIEDSQREWKLALEQFRMAANKPIINFNSKKYRVGDIVALDGQAHPNAALVAKLQQELLCTQLDFHYRCALIQLSDTMKKVDQAFFEARIAVASQNTERATEILEGAFEVVLTKFSDPEDRLAAATCIQSEWKLYNDLQPTVAVDGGTSASSAGLKDLRDTYELLLERDRDRSMRLVSGTTSDENRR